MSAIYLFSIYRRIERKWVARFKALKLINAKIAVAAERMLQGRLSGGRILIPVRIADRRRIVGHKSDD
jgi:hypothetical protein